MIKSLLIGGLLIVVLNLEAQENPDQTMDKSIHTILVHPVGDPTGVPALFLNGNSSLLVSFDDFKASYQSYYYTIQLMNADWQPVQVSPFDYIQGFNQNKISSFSISSIAIQPYYHYQFSFPNANCRPTKPGNYVLKVFKDGDESKLLFTRRFFVVEDLTSIAALVQEPFDGSISRTRQKIQLNVDVKKLSYFQPDQLSVQVVQNYRYNDPIIVKTPSFIRGNNIEYNSERDLIFPAGKEFRWLDLQNLRLRSDRISQFENTDGMTKVILKPDVSRVSTPYFSFNDLDGQFLISNTESLQSETQNDYAQVVFTYIPKERIPYYGETLYLSGALTQNILNQDAVMQFNAQKGQYEKTLILKQGYYNYQYLLRDNKDPQPEQDFAETEGDHWETQNTYTILVYYRPAGARHDYLVGLTTVNSKQSW